MELFIALAGSPLMELHTPKTNDLRFLSHEVDAIPEISKGQVAATVEYGYEETGGSHDSASIDLKSDVGTASLKFFKQNNTWIYSGHVEINGEFDQYAGQTTHDNVKAIARKVRALAIRLA